MATNIQDGIYGARTTQAAVYEKDNALVVEVRFELCDEQGNAYTQTGTDGREYAIERNKRHYLVNGKTGAVNTKVVEGMQKWAKGWDGIDPFWWTDTANLDAIGLVDLTLETKPYTAADGTQKTYQEVKWVDPAGGRKGNGKMVESGDRAAIMAKYGAKFKAAFGGRPKAVPAGGAPMAAPRPQAASAAPARPTAAPAPKSAPKAPAAAPATCPYPDGMAGANKAWDEFNAANPDAKQADLTDRWFEAIDKHSDGKDQQDMTGRQWAKVMAELTGGDPDDMPF